jgi:hypothetical protein
LVGRSLTHRGPWNNRMREGNRGKRRVRGNGIVIESIC